MAALAYLLLPVTGLLAYSLGSIVRTRFHGLQAVFFGFVWPLALYAASAVAAAATVVVFWLGALVWLGLLVGAASGRDPRLPLIGTVLRRWAEIDVRAGRG